MGTGGSPAVRSPTIEAAFSRQPLAVSFAALMHVIVLIPQQIGAAKFQKIENELLSDDLSQLNRLETAGPSSALARAFGITSLLVAAIAALLQSTRRLTRRRGS
jgi:hypothetical protein